MEKEARRLTPHDIAACETEDEGTAPYTIDTKEKTLALCPLDYGREGGAWEMSWE